MRRLLRQFRRDECGAVTVDWVVLTAICIGLTIAIIFVLREAAIQPADSLGNWLAVRQVGN